jgi:GntR family transcriptional repressor for pyruvate dehydrogenase complex
MQVFNSLGDRELLSKQVCSAIEEAIRSKKFVPGAKLPSELELCHLFGVSRTAVREALRMLSAKGLISIYKGKGIYVRGLSPEYVKDSMHNYLEMKTTNNNALEVIQARIIIEPSIAEYAAINRSEEDLAAMLENIEAMKKNNDQAEHARLDSDFHLLIAEASGSHIMPLILEPIHRLMPKIKKEIMSVIPGAKEAAITWHKKVIDAISSKDPKAAYFAMKHHLEIAKDQTERMLEKASLVSEQDEVA